MKQTSLDINGPILSFTTNPVGVASTGTIVGSTGGGTVTFVGIATATFPTQVPVNYATGTGNISYQWYESDVGVLSNNTYITGTATTTLTITNLITPTDNNRRFYLTANYIASAYQTSSPITAGTARSTGNSINGTISSSIATLTVYPLIIITNQPISNAGVLNENINFQINTNLTDSFYDSGTSYQWQLNGDDIDDGSIVAFSRITTVSGTKTPSITIKSDVVGIQTIRCKVSNTFSTNSPVLSNVVNFTAISNAEQFNVIIEKIGTNNIAEISTINLYQENVNYLFETGTTNLYSFYSPDRNIDVEMDLYGGKGFNRGFNSGGEGGFSRIRFTMNRNTEYIIAGLVSNINTPFIYKKAQLIACVGGGGNAGNLGTGGNGGGIGVPGANGFGRGGGSGGASVTVGNLSENGIFGSSVGTRLNPVFPDTKATYPNGGRVLPCSRGIYWREQGYNSCGDLGDIKFILSNGVIVNNTAQISRGFKSGYLINETAGILSINVSDGVSRGGNGATGGNGGSGGGGGGGSGYTDGTVTISYTQQGGSTGPAKVILRRV